MRKLLSYLPIIALPFLKGGNVSRIEEKSGEPPPTEEEKVIMNEQFEIIDRIVKSIFEEMEKDAERIRKRDKWAIKMRPEVVRAYTYETGPPQTMEQLDGSTYEVDYYEVCLTEDYWNKERANALAMALVRVQEELGISEAEIDAILEDLSWNFDFQVENLGYANAGGGYTIYSNSSLYTSASAADSMNTNSIIFHEFWHQVLASKNERFIRASEEGMAGYLTQIGFPESHTVITGNYDVEVFQISLLGRNYILAMLDDYDALIDEMGENTGRKDKWGDYEFDDNWTKSTAYEYGRGEFFITWDIMDLEGNRKCFDEIYAGGSVLRDLTRDTYEKGHHKMAAIQDAIECLGLDWPIIWEHYMGPYSEVPNAYPEL